MKTTIRRMGNSHGVIIPKPLLLEIGVKVDDPIDIRVRKGRLVIEPVKRVPRDGWAAAGQAIHEAGDDKLVWPEFANEPGKDPAA